MPRTLTRAIGQLVNGEAVDWEGLLEEAADASERARLADLRALTQLEGPFPTARDAAVAPGPATDDPSAPKRQWGHLELLEEIGQGSYGVVYRAWDPRLG